MLIPYQEFLLAYEDYLDSEDRHSMLVALKKLDQLEVALKDWQANQLPAEAVVGAYFAALELPVAATTNLALGQLVKLELAKYPVGQYGRLSGVVSYIQPPLALKGNYRVIADLPQNLSMSKGDTIKFENGLLANATMTTESVSLLTKILQR